MLRKKFQKRFEAVPEAFCVTFFNGSRDNDKVESRAYLYVQ